MKINTSDPLMDGLANTVKGLLPPGHTVAIIVFNETTREFSITHDCGVQRIHDVSDSLRGKRRVAA